MQCSWNVFHQYQLHILENCENLFLQSACSQLNVAAFIKNSQSFRLTYVCICKCLSNQIKLLIKSDCQFYNQFY